MKVEEHVEDQSLSLAGIIFVYFVARIFLGRRLYGGYSSVKLIQRDVFICESYYLLLYVGLRGGRWGGSEWE
jgi:hypothetical protein